MNENIGVHCHHPENSKPTRVKTQSKGSHTKGPGERLHLTALAHAYDYATNLKLRKNKSKVNATDIREGLCLAGSTKCDFSPTGLSPRPVCGSHTAGYIRIVLEKMAQLCV